MDKELIYKLAAANLQKQASILTTLKKLLLIKKKPVPVNDQGPFEGWLRDQALKQFKRLGRI